MKKEEEFSEPGLYTSGSDLTRMGLNEIIETLPDPAYGTVLITGLPVAAQATYLVGRLVWQGLHRSSGRESDGRISLRDLHETILMTCGPHCYSYDELMDMVETICDNKSWNGYVIDQEVELKYESVSDEYRDDLWLNTVLATIVSRILGAWITDVLVEQLSATYSRHKNPSELMKKLSVQSKVA